MQPIPQLMNSQGEPLLQRLYQPYKWMRVAAILFIVGGILAALGFTGKLPPPSALKGIKLISAVTVPSVLFIGTGFVIYRARHSEMGSGKVSGTNHWMITKQRPLSDEYQYDLSHVDAHGNGVAIAYCKLPKWGSLTGLGLALIAPIYIVCAVAYNLIRFVVIPFYILIRIAQEKWKGSLLYPNQREFHFSDIPIEMGRSLWRALKAPFYGTALFYAGLKATVDPLNAVKEGGAIEADWNEGAPLRYEGYWMMVRWAFPGWKWEGGGGPLSLGRNGFFAAGSWQPHYVVTLQNWKETNYREINGSLLQEHNPEGRCWYLPKPDGDGNDGPYTPQELRDKRLSDESLVGHTQMRKYKKLSEIPHLKAFIDA